MNRVDDKGPGVVADADSRMARDVTGLSGWSHFDHMADIGVRGFGPTKAAAFEQVALALTGVVAALETVRPLIRVEVTCRADDDGLLLVAWLNAVIYEMAVRHMLFARYLVALSDHQLQASAWGESVVPERHHPAVDVKGATFTALQVSRSPGGRWTAQTVVDV